MYPIQPIMPPMMKEEFLYQESFHKKNSDSMFLGKSAEHIVASYLLKNKINFAEPEVDQGNDWWVEDTNNRKQVRRAQVKKVIAKIQLDQEIYDTQGKEVYVTKYDFRFQSSGLKEKPGVVSSNIATSGGGVCRRQYGPEEIDVFYEVLVTPYRELIFEIKSEDVPVGDDGFFKQSKSLILDRVQTQPPRRGKDTPIDIRSMLISEQYDARLIRANQDFFFPPEQPTIMEFLS